MAYWIAGGVLVIGIIWPTVINLLVFGKLRRPREEKGISLMGVIGIIALLLALLLPAVSGFRQRAIEVKCQATLRNMGWAGQLHLNDHKGFLPLAGWQFNPGGGVLNPQ